MSGPAIRTRPTGRRPGDSGTRDAILDAALALFAECGYDGASVRAIAADAGVDPALIRHFFGDKETLFASTITDRTEILEHLAGALNGDTERLGRRVTDAYLRLWEEPNTRLILLALVRSATTSPRAAEVLREIMGARARLAAGPASEQRHRISLAAAHLFGVAFARYVIRLPALADIDHEVLVDEIAPTIQRYLAGNLT